MGTLRLKIERLRRKEFKKGRSTISKRERERERIWKHMFLYNKIITPIRIIDLIFSIDNSLFRTSTR
jgi:predicted tellurium resistance membrane protein TerC